MARARNIKPSFFTNEQLSDSSPLGRLLFIGLWTMADYKGDLEWKEKTLKIQILPWDDCSVKELAINLDKSGLIRFYSDGVKIYINIPNFSKHQNPHKNERDKGSDIPSYSNESRQLIDFKGLTINRDLSGLKPNDSHSNHAESLILNPSTLNPETRIPESGVPAAQALVVEESGSGVVERVFEHWRTVMNSPRAKLDEKRKKFIRQAIKLKYTEDELLAAITGCAKDPWSMGQNERFKPFNEISLIFRDAEHIDKFIAISRLPAAPRSTNFSTQKKFDAVDYVNNRREAEREGGEARDITPPALQPEQIANAHGNLFENELEPEQ